MIADQRLQAAGASILHAIDAQAWLGCRAGSRPGRGAGEAVRDLRVDVPYGRDGSGVEADRKGFVDHLDHAGLLKMLAWRIADRACLGRMRTWLKAGMLEPEGRVLHPDPGVPPGGVVSPVVANG